MGANSFPIDLVLFGMIAAFLVLRLRSILGRRSGYERPPETRVPKARAEPPRPNGAPTIDGRATPPPPPAFLARDPNPRAAPGYPPMGQPPIGQPPIGQPSTPQAPIARPLPEPSSPAALGLARMRRIAPDFDPARFLAGAEAAFHIIVTAFARGDRAALRPLLGEATWHAFDGAITARTEAEHRQRTEILSVREVAIEAAELAGTEASITLRIVSDQINVTEDKDGHAVTGTDALTEIIDLWTFRRDLAQTADPTWRLVEARAG